MNILDHWLIYSGAMDWVQKLKWAGIKDYNKAVRYALTEPLDGQTDTYVKAHNNFKFYWMLRAGHAVSQNFKAGICSAAFEVSLFIFGHHATI